MDSKNQCPSYVLKRLLLYILRRLRVALWSHFAAFLTLLGTISTCFFRIQDTSTVQVAAKVGKEGLKGAAALSSKLLRVHKGTPGTARGEDNRRARRHTTIPHAC